MESQKPQADLALVTGAFGFVGRHVARELAGQGYRVIGIGNGGWAREQWSAWGMAAWHEATITLEALAAMPDTPELIVHCAGSGSVAFSMASPFQDCGRTVDSTLAVLEFQRLKAPAAKLALPSSAGVYGNVERMPITVDTPLRPVSPYGVHKKIAEELCQSYGGHFGVASVIVRLFSVYGPGLRKQLLWDACNKMRDDKASFGGTGNETRDWIHVEDAARLIVLAVERADPACPIVNGGNGVAVPNRELLGELALAMGAPPPRFSGAGRAGDPVHYQANITEALAAGWTPRHGWREGVRAYAHWFEAGAA